MKKMIGVQILKSKYNLKNRRIDEKIIGVQILKSKYNLKNRRIDEKIKRRTDLKIKI